MPGRKYAFNDTYRYGFNGKENDNEVKGEGSQQDYGMRIYDPRLGRFLSVDPLQKNYPFYSPYQFSGNNPIFSIDIDGMEAEKQLNPVEIADILKHSEHTANWMLKARIIEKMPKLTLTTKELTDISATVIGESGHGDLSTDQQVKIGWVYYNRIAKSGFKEGMSGSYAYNRSHPNRHKDVLPTVDVMAVMVFLGDNTYSNKSAEGAFGVKNISELIKVKDTYTQGYLQKGKELNDLLTSEFSDPFKNPVPGFRNQGYHGDFNRKDAMWNMARAYYWLQEDGKVAKGFATTFVLKLRTDGAENKTTFIFNLEEIEKYFKKNPDQLPKNVPLYDPQTDTKQKNP